MRDVFDSTKRRATSAAQHNTTTANPHTLETTQRAIRDRDQNVGGNNPHRQSVAAEQRAAVSGAQFEARVAASAAVVNAGGTFDAGHQTAILQAKTAMKNEFEASLSELRKTAPPFMQDQMRNTRLQRVGRATMPERGSIEDID
ncbi:hypothetical protein [Thalassolituus alkanivorans]|jgi:hypothetical protein|uniref:hypothetical protein n=1 Tax=Thalassolituus alkanivorans TaxID=2881055 RepID=UPI000C606B02|nr:hypothetical protein [Thalassolituus alkanivorans]MAY14713.1 hypothetical protein [Oceanospirillaceae bacterium]MCB2386560.1 hypothetical protein [Thalassolituus alkanivorans]MCB2422917.1 hypothetical protein [Thalassolituus alkanivorans]|tara:strand:- start:589 stop:1020 length:432 start_codon:yes stop_codon:yes gene_type:complete